MTEGPAGTEYYIVGRRPVKLVRLPDGGGRVLGFDWETGELVRVTGYLARISAGRTEDVERVTEEEFERQVAALRADIGGRAE